MGPTAWTDIDLKALAHNVQAVRKLAPNSRVLAMAKANAYGHGLIECAKVYAEHADAIAVARLEEAEALRQAGIHSRIVLLGTWLTEDSLVKAAALKLDIVIHDSQAAALLAGEALQLQQPLNVWLKLNTGMNRLGLSTEDFKKAHQLLSQSKNVAEIVHMSHFAEAESRHSSMSDEQAAKLRTVSQGCGRVPISLCNSAGIIDHPDHHADWVRPGIMLYGDNPCATPSIDTPDSNSSLDLQAVMQFKARVVALQAIEAGQRVGYNGTWTAEQNTRLALLGVGYGDGYPRHVKNGTPVWLGGQRHALAGRVSMDLIAVDIGEREDIQIGDIAELWGSHIPVAEIAAAANTISYELFTGISQRVPRILQG